jgi:hypothetical protein
MADNLIKTTVEIDTNQAQRSIVQLNSIASNGTKTLEERIIAKNKAVELQNALSKKTIDALENERRTLEGRGATEKELKAIFDKLNKAKLDSLKVSEAGIKVEDRLNSSLKKETSASITLNSAYNKLTNARSESKRKLLDLISSENASTDAIKKAQKEFDTLDTKVRKADRAVGDFSKSSKGISGTIGSLTSGVKNLVGAFGLVAGISLFANVLKGAYNTIKDFDKVSADLAATLGTNREGIKGLTDNAKELGATTRFTASEIVGLQKELGKLGFSEPEILASTKAISTLASAVDTDLANAALIAGQTLRAFNLDASQMGRVVDVMAKSFTSSALDITTFKESMKFVAPVANALNVPIEQTTALLGVLADNGIKGSMAGTSLRRIFSEITKTGKPFNEGLREIAKNGISVTDSMDEVGRTASTSLLVLGKNIPKIEALGIALNEAGGAAQKMADEQLNSLSGQTTLMSSAFDGLILSLNNGDGALSKFFTGTVQIITEALNTLTKFNATFSDLRNIAAGESLKADTQIYLGLDPKRTKAIAEENKKIAIEETNTLNKRLKESTKIFEELDKLKLSNLKRSNRQDRAQAKEDIDKINKDLGVRRGRIQAANAALKSLQPKSGGVVGGDSGLDEKEIAANEKAMAKRDAAQKKAEAERKRAQDEKIKAAKLEFDNQSKIDEMDIQRRKSLGENTDKLQIDLLERRKNNELQNDELTEIGKAEIRGRYQVLEDEVKANRLQRESDSKIALEEKDLQDRQANGENVLALQLDFLERQRQAEVFKKDLTESEKALIDIKYHDLAEQAQLDSDQKELEAKRLKGENTFALELQQLIDKQTRDFTFLDAKKIKELENTELTESQKNDIINKYATARGEIVAVSEKSIGDIRTKEANRQMDKAAELFGIQREVAIAQAIMNAPTAISNIWSAKSPYPFPLSVAFKAAETATTIIPIIKGLADIKKVRFPSRKSGGGGAGGGSISSAATSVATAGVSSIAANNAARLGIDPSIGSNANANAANNARGGMSQGIVFSESRYNDFKTQVAFKENKTKI